MTARISSRFSWLLVGGIVLALALARRAYCVDDGYIFVRVAHNLAHGVGWSFNPHLPVNAMTSVLWTLILVPVAWQGSLPPAVPCALFSLCVLAMGLLMARLWAGPTGRFGVWLVALCTACPTLWDSVGLETALEAALVIWAISAYTAQRDWLAGVALGLAVLGRPDAGLLGVLLFAHGLIAERRFKWRLPMASLALVLPWCVYAYCSFGSILPVTLHAKAVQSSLGWWGQQPPFLVSALLYGHWPLVALGLALGGALCAPRVYARMPTSARLFVAYGLAHAVAYTLIRAPSGYFWYYVPLHLSLLVAGLWGVLALGAFVAARLRGSTDPSGVESLAAAERGTGLVAACLVLGAMFSVAREEGVYRQSPQYREVAGVVRARAAPEDAVAAVEIGYIGYFADRPVLDIHGLIHPEATPRIARGESTWWLERQPRFVVTHEPAWFGEPAAAESPPGVAAAFQNQYKSIYRAPITPGTALLLWERL